MLLYNDLRLPASGAGLFLSDRWPLTSCSHIVSPPKHLISKVVKSSVTICLGSCSRRSTARQHKAVICLLWQKGSKTVCPDVVLALCGEKQKLAVFTCLLSDTLFYFPHSHQHNSLKLNVCAKSSCAIFTLKTCQEPLQKIDVFGE